MPQEQSSFAQLMGRNRRNKTADENEFAILIAEDNEVNAKVMKAFLTPFNTKLYFARDGRKAVSIFKTRKVDLVLMDINMPEMDGFEATKAIRAIEQERGASQTPIIAVTAHVKPADQHVCIASSMNDYLHKPVKVDDLKRSFQIWAPDLRYTPPAKTAAGASAA